VQLGDGLVALPLDDDNREQFGGAVHRRCRRQASVWSQSRPPPVSTASWRRAEAMAADYRTVTRPPRPHARSEPPVGGGQRCGCGGRSTGSSRDFFPPPERRQAERAVAELAALVEARR
jgi:hypothetical protein